VDATEAIMPLSFVSPQVRMCACARQWLLFFDEYGQTKPNQIRRVRPIQPFDIDDVCFVSVSVSVPVPVPVHRG